MPRSRPGAGLIALAILSFILAIITGPEQLYYVLFAINPHLFGIGPNTNFMGETWYAYVLNGDNSYTHFDAGLFTGAVEDAFMLAPCYLVCGIGLLRRSRWVVPLGLFTAGMIWYAIIYFIVGDLASGLGSVTNEATFWAPLALYVAYPIWTVITLVFQRKQFAR
ncbi:MAG TPA: hypothetical protein VF808_08770 [Ktedonobacterales bacterium]